MNINISNLCNREIILPLSVISGAKRKFQANWIKENPWLRYSENTDSVYCVYCVLFAPKEKANLTFSFLSPVNNWSNMSQLIKRHLLEKSKHHEYMRMADDFMKVVQCKSPSFASTLSKAHQESIAKNRHVLSKVIEVILLCSRQNIPLRGHREDHSNFHAILHTMAKTDTILAEHLAFSTDVKYTSPEIQNEIINICAKHVLNKLISSYRKAIYQGPIFCVYSIC